MARITNSQKYNILQVNILKLYHLALTNLELGEIDHRVILANWRGAQPYSAQIVTSSTFSVHSIDKDFSPLYSESSLHRIVNRAAFNDLVINKTKTAELKNVIKFFYATVLLHFVTSYVEETSIKNKRDIIKFQRMSLEHIYESYREFYLLPQGASFFKNSKSVFLNKALFEMLTRNPTLKDYYEEANFYGTI